MMNTPLNDTLVQ